jgi:ABC-type dipeptide/oligopeptide/nickel transport system permease subunit
MFSWHDDARLCGGCTGRPVNLTIPAPLLAVSPGLMIFVAVLSFNLLGDRLRDALDPRLNRLDSLS